MEILAFSKTGRMKSLRKAQQQKMKQQRREDIEFLTNTVMPTSDVFQVEA